MKILHFIGVCSFTSNEEAVETNFGKGLWDDEMVVTKVEEISVEDFPIPLPRPIEEMGKNMIGKVPNPPVEGINEVEGWLIDEEVDTMKSVLDEFSKRFGEIHNKPKVQDPFLAFLKMMSEALGGIREQIENKLGDETENVDKPEEMEQGHETES